MGDYDLSFYFDAPAREFAFVVGGAYVQGATPSPAGRTAPRERSRGSFCQPGIAMFHERYGDNADRRPDPDARQDIPATLLALKQLAEGA